MIFSRDGNLIAFNDKKSLIKTLVKWSKNIEKYFEEEIRRKK